MYDDMNNNGSYSGNGYDNGGYGNGYNSGSYGNGGYSNGSYGNGQPAYDRPLTRKARRAMKKVQKLDRKKASGNGGKKGMNRFAKGVVAVACAVVLGAIAGAGCYGVSYAGYTIFPIKTQQSQAQSGTAEHATQVSTPVAAGNRDIKATVYDVSDIVDSVISSVVAINGKYTEEVNYGFWGSQTYQSTVSGSGIIIEQTDNELLVVTNAHVIDNVEDLAVTLYDGNEIPASIKGSKSEYDLAVLSLKLSDIPAGANYSIATLGNSADIRVGEAAIAVGNSMGYGISVTTGCISALNKTVTVENTEYRNLIQTDAAINPGNSGGALFNAQGEVIGINSVKMKQTGVEGMGYAIPISTAKPIIEELMTKTTKDKVAEGQESFLGISGVNVTEDVSQMYGMPKGIYVAQVYEGTAAANAGLVKGDIITKFDGSTVSSMEDLQKMMQYYAAGTQVDITIQQGSPSGYQEKTVTVTLGAKAHQNS